ncbi:hypothetical protein ACFE04_003038 [Oxalis oulophora]
MGKSSKKSATKVEAAPAVVTPVKSGKKGKREAEEALEIINEKKQKIDASTKKALEKSKKDTKVSKKKEESSSDDSSSESEEEEKVVPKKQAPVKKVESSDSDSEEDSSSDDEPAKKPVAAAKNGAVAAKKVESSDESDESSDSDSEDEKTAKPAAKNGKVEAKKVESSESSDSDSDSDDKTAAAKKTTSVVAKKESESSDEESSDEESEEEKPAKTPKKKDADVEMVDAKSAKKESKTPVAAPAQSGGSKTLFVGNLSYQVEQSDVEKFFKSAGEVVDVRFAQDPEGNFKGFGHVEFATAEAAQKALEMNGKDLCGRGVRLDLAKERGEFTPREARPPSQTIFVKGFDTNLGEDEIRSSLEKHFGDCGEMTRISIPKDFDSGYSKGMAYIDFTSSESLSKALELNGEELGGYPLVLENYVWIFLEYYVVLS